jgi:hypothetical protein
MGTKPNTYAINAYSYDGHTARHAHWRVTARSPRLAAHHVAYRLVIAQAAGRWQFVVRHTAQAVIARYETTVSRQRFAPMRTVGVA